MRVVSTFGAMPPWPPEVFPPVRALSRSLDILSLKDLVGIHSLTHSLIQQSFISYFIQAHFEQEVPQGLGGQL